MLKFSYGTKLEQLADTLLAELDACPPKNLLSPEIFVVQNHGIGQWLSLYMAREQGIAANLKFEFPSERLWSLIRQMDSDIPQDLPSDRGPMTWSLMKLLQDAELLSEFENLRHYIEDEDPIQQSVRRWKLSAKIADVFDQYLIYRPELVMGWQRQELTYGMEAEKWQARLWRRLVTHWEQYYEESSWLHRAELQQALLQSIEDGSLDSKALPDRVTVFGVSMMSPAFIETMVQLSRLIDVHIYQIAIDPALKDSEQFANPLLQSLGGLETDMMAHLSQQVKDNTQVKKGTEWEQVVSPNSGKLSVLQSIGQDLREDKAPSGRSLNVPALDASIQVHSCHSPMREVEVLYDRLLAVLDDNPELSPSDILIMTPDIETYAPVIEAVFGMSDDGQPEIPYSMADRGLDGNAATQSFLSILALCESRFKVTDMLDLLDGDPIQTAFGFSDDDLNQMERWVADNRIRWGIDAPFKQQMDIPKSDSFTWVSGLNRIMLGYTMNPDDDSLYLGIFPYDEIATSNDAALAGTFSYFLQSLFDFSRTAQKAKSPTEWTELLSRLVDTFLQDTDDYFREISQIRGAIEQFQKVASLGNYQDEVPFRIIRSWFQEQLEEQGSGGGRIGRGVTFSSLMPMRSIPFKMIGMIGMNDGAFPRSKIPIEFDLMHLEPQPGDPVRADEDRYLFMESLLSARTHLYFSYVGQSNRQDSEFPPSVVLKEFLDYLEEYYGLKAAELVQKHRLQAFSSAYFKDEPLTSYSETQRKISQQLLNGQEGGSQFMSRRLPAPDEAAKGCSLGNLISFFQHPPKYLLQSRLGIYLREQDVLTEDREPFALNGLDGYQVGQELLDRYIKDKPLDSYQQILDSRDLLPEGWSGQQAYRQKVTEVREFGSEIREAFNQQALDDREIDITIGEFRIVGMLSDIYEGALLRYRFGRMRPKDLIDLWIRHLLFQQLKPESHPGYSCLFTRDKKTPFAAYKLSPLEDSEDILATLLDLYWRGLQECIYFFPETSFAYAREVCHRGKEPRSGLKKASYKWDRTYGAYPGEVGDPYNKMILGRKNPLRQERFQEVANRFWAPFFSVLNQEDD